MCDTGFGAYDNWISPLVGLSWLQVMNYRRGSDLNFRVLGGGAEDQTQGLIYTVQGPNH